MNKKIFPLFSLLLMFALAFTSFAPAYAAAQDTSPAITGGSYPPGYVPAVNLQVVYNPATNQIVLTAAFADNFVIKRGDVSVRSAKPTIAWVKTATLYNTKQIQLSYVLPRGSTGSYCASVTLTGSTGSVKLSPMLVGTASKCIVIPLRK